MRVMRVPVIQWVHREFDAPDPWESTAVPVHWRLLVCQMLGGPNLNLSPRPRTTPAESNDVPEGVGFLKTAQFSLVIATAADKRYRVVPSALYELWRAGRVQDADLPPLIHAMEGKLWKIVDYPGTLPYVCWLMGWIVVLGALVLFAAFVLFGFFFLLYPRHPERVTEYTDWDPWLSRPMNNEQSLNLHGDQEPVAIIALPSPAVPPPGMKSDGPFSGPMTMLAVVQAQGEKRLLLIHPSNVYRSPGLDGGPAGPPTLHLVTGSLLRTGNTGLQAAAASAKQRYPDLNTDLVLCAGWDWPDTVSPGEARFPQAKDSWMAVAAVGAFPGLTLLISLPFWLACWLFKIRRRRLATRFLDALTWYGRHWLRGSPGVAAR